MGPTLGRGGGRGVVRLSYCVLGYGALEPGSSVWTQTQAGAFTTRPQALLSVVGTAPRGTGRELSSLRRSKGICQQRVACRPGCQTAAQRPLTTAWLEVRAEAKVLQPLGKMCLTGEGTLWGAASSLG